MTYAKAKITLEGMIKALIHHIELAERGAIQEDCIMCRKKDLHDYRGILGVIEEQHKRLEDLK